MNTLVIVERELIVRARSPHMHWLRLAFAAVGALLCLQFFLLWMGMSLPQIGAYTFQTLAWLAVLPTCAGFVLTADSVSSERRDGTLGLLLLTRIGIPDVLAGKLASAGLTAHLGLMSITPVLMLPVLAGGVRWTQVVMVALSLPGLLFFSLCAGLWASSRSHRMAQALVLASIRVSLLTLLPLIVSALLRTAGSPGMADWVRSMSPGGAFLWGSDFLATFSAPGYWISVTLGFVYGCILLRTAAHHVHRHWRESADPAHPRPAHSIGKHVSEVDQPPVRWLLLRSRTQSRAIWLGATLLLLPRLVNAIIGVLGNPGIGLSSAVYLGSAVAAGLAFAYAGAVFFLEGRRTGELELLRTTPEGFRSVVSEQWVVLRERLLRPLFLALAVMLLVEAAGWSRMSAMMAVSQVPRGLVTLAGTVFDVVALCWLGMWFGYRSRSTWSALLWPVALVAGLDLLLSYATYGVFGLAFRAASAPGGMGTMFMTVYMTLPALMCIAKQVWLIRWARRRLRETLSGGPLEPVDLRGSVSRSAQRALAAAQRARHWTGGGE